MSDSLIADRYNSGKQRWALVDFEALKPMVEVLAFGAKKYSDDNWRKGLKTKEVCESLLRHLTAYLSGQDDDAESGLPEVGHILCNAMFLSHMHLFRPDMDNRSGKEEDDRSNLIKRAEDASKKFKDYLNAKVGSQYPKGKSIYFSDDDIIKNPGSWKDLVSDRMGETTIEVTMSDGSQWIMTRK